MENGICDKYKENDSYPPVLGQKISTYVTNHYLYIEYSAPWIEPYAI